MAVGALIAVLCGLCAGYFEIAFTSQGVNSDSFVLPLVLGGVPALVGVGLFFLGRALFRRPPRPKADQF